MSITIDGITHERFFHPEPGEVHTTYGRLEPPVLVSHHDQPLGLVHAFQVEVTDGGEPYVQLSAHGVTAKGERDKRGTTASVYGPEADALKERIVSFINEQEDRP